MNEIVWIELDAMQRKSMDILSDLECDKNDLLVISMNMQIISNKNTRENRGNFTLRPNAQRGL